MSVYRRFHGHGLPLLITSNMEGRRRVLADERAANLLLAKIDQARGETGFELHAYVLMPDHIHLIITVPIDEKVGRIMQLIKGRFSYEYHRAFGGSGNLWQGRFHERALRSERAFLAALEYVHYNPVVAGLCQEPDAYAWSSARAWSAETAVLSG